MWVYGPIDMFSLELLKLRTLCPDRFKLETCNFTALQEEKFLCDQHHSILTSSFDFVFSVLIHFKTQSSFYDVTLPLGFG